MFGPRFMVDRWEDWPAIAVATKLWTCNLNP
jgi:hypothetical protein